MYRRKPRLNPLVPVLILVLVLTALTGTTVAKYVHEQTMSASVTFTATIAENMTLLEHEAVRAADGSYSLKIDEDDIYEYTVNGNDYVLIPGLDVPKDPFITITGKTPIPAYLYVEVIYDANLLVGYLPDSCWELVKESDSSPYTTSNGGSLYVYKGSGTSALALTDQNCLNSTTFNILKNKTVYVSQKLVTNNFTQKDMKFYAYLLEVPENFTDAKAVFEVFYPPTGT